MGRASVIISFKKQLNNPMAQTLGGIYEDFIKGGGLYKDVVGAQGDLMRDFWKKYNVPLSAETKEQYGVK